MKIEILQEELVKGLAIVTRAVASRPQLAVLSNILIEAKKEGLGISATDLELGMGIDLNAKVVEEGIITVPAKTLYEFVSSVNAGKIELSLDKETLKVIAGSYVGKFQTIAADEFPKLPELGEGKSIRVDFGEFAKAAQMVLFAAARDSLRPVLTGILIEVGENALNIVATDGFRLACRKMKAETGDLPTSTLLVPMRAVAEVTRVEDGGKLEIVHMPKTNQVVFRTGSTKLVTQTIDGNYPDYNKIIPKEFESEMVISKEELAQAVKATHIFARENSNMMRWFVGKNGLEIKAESPERGESAVEVPVTLDGEGGEVVFNTKFVLDFLGATGAQNIRFGMGEKLAPCAFREDGKDETLYVVMPINA